MVKALNINMFHKNGVPRFYTQNLEHSCFSKKERRENFKFFMENQKIGTRVLLQSQCKAFVGTM